MPTYTALLRGINVGGKNKLAMATVAEMFTSAGCMDVQTYIQSGNVLFTATAALAKRVPRIISTNIADEFKYKVPVVIRTADELAKIVKNNPFLRPGEDDSALYVVFLTDEPQRRRIASLDPSQSPGDSFEVRGREIYLRLPNGAARTKFSNAYFDSALLTTSTARNWRTVTKLNELCSAANPKMSRSK